MALPATPQALYDVLAADAVIAPLLGVYTFKAGSTLPAIAVLFPNEKPEQGTVCTGVEIVVNRLAATESIPYMTGDADQSRVIRCYVSQWEVDPIDWVPLTITAAALVSNVATITVGAHAIPAGSPITVAGLTAPFAALNGNYVIAAAGATTISYARTGADIAGAAVAGTANAGSAPDARNVEAVKDRVLALLEGAADAVPTAFDDALTGLAQYAIKYTVEDAATIASAP